MIDNLEPKPDMWEANPKLKMLSLVFIFVFLFSGIALVMFSVWSNQYRQKIYEETQNSLPKHEVSQSVNQQVSDSEIKDWVTYKNDQYGFKFEYPAGWLLRDKIFEAACEAEGKKDCRLDIANYDLSVDFISKDNKPWNKYCNKKTLYGASEDKRCERLAIYYNKDAVIDWENSVSIITNDESEILISFNNKAKISEDAIKKILVSFTFFDISNGTKKCESYQFGPNCPNYCIMSCVPGQCVKDGPCTTDCGGPGSCKAPTKEEKNPK